METKPRGWTLFFSGLSQTGYIYSKSIYNKEHEYDEYVDVIEATPGVLAADDLYEALEYYFSVLEEVRGKDWDKKPDHVLAKMLNAHKKARGNNG